ncbi:glutamate 5-kinase [Alistipes sp. An116]|uniref:glutamate 5-kinase n=1 Tax=Alistipes sp. An116 TaxID=1965546 RepID=UPI000B369588|nr:glutamate 5-kinase [Alistipes sp. An116]OUQ52302.1 glutamate 5-kinase [Alistipes sp. An116]
MIQEGKYRRIVVKVGSNVLTREEGRPDTTRISALVDQLARLHRAGIETILVSSGAVASGRSLLEPCTGRIDTVSARQLYSAVGQVRLMTRYYDLFHEYGIACGQVLTTRESLSTRRQYLNQRNCMEAMLTAGVIPIVNENDTISVTELMFTDNDELSGLVAAMMGADALLILSNIDGIYDGSPSDPASRVIRRVAPGEDLSPYIDATRSSRGRGGMTSKNRIASRVAGEGIEVVIANGRRDNILTELVLGDGEVICTRFEPSARPASGLKKWIASSEGFAKGALRLDAGAVEAIRRSQAASILAVGVTQVEGDFERDDIVRILSPEGMPLGVGRIACDSATARRNLGRKGLRPLIHCDYLYLE